VTQGRREAAAIEEGIQAHDIRVLHQDTANSGKLEVVEGPEGMTMQRTSTTSTTVDPKTAGKEEDKEEDLSHGGASSSTMAGSPSVDG
jgi:hypothetical protein